MEIRRLISNKPLSLNCVERESASGLFIYDSFFAADGAANSVVWYRCANRDVNGATLRIA